MEDVKSNKLLVLTVLGAGHRHERDAWQYLPAWGTVWSMSVCAPFEGAVALPHVLFLGHERSATVHAAFVFLLNVLPRACPALLA